MNADFPAQAVLDYIEENLHEPIELEMLAAKAFVSQPQLYRLFYACTGHTVKEYIRKRRISSAAEWLENGRRPLKQIALDCGFDSFQSFAKAFKKITGVTPAEYRSTAYTYFSFEPIRLPVKAKPQTAVKIVNMPSKSALVYCHSSPHREGLEPDAFQAAYEAVLAMGWNAAKTRFFGHDWHPEQEDPQQGSSLYGYRMMVLTPPEADPNPVKSDWHAESFPSGLYAVSTVPPESASSVIGAWNQLLSEWLPASAFSRREGPFVEEFIHFRGKVARMRLYLPIERQNEQPFIHIAQVGARQVAFVKSFGPNAREEADRTLAKWIDASVILQGRTKCSYYMSYRYGVCESSVRYWSEAGVTLEEEIALTNGVETKRLGGGEYACLTTEAYGTMQGVLELLHGWLDHQELYTRDESREWFAEYVVHKDQPIDRIKATCYLPVQDAGRSTDKLSKERRQNNGGTSKR